MTRLFLDIPLAPDIPLPLPPAQAHFLKNVLRLMPGDTVLVFNGQDGEWRTRIETLGKKNGLLHAEQQTRPQRQEPDVWLLFAPVKKAPVDFLAQKATELGVSRLQPVFTRRTVPSRINLRRLHANCIEAAEQTGRLTIPAVAEALPLESLLPALPVERRLLLCDETRQCPDIHAVLSHQPRGKWAILIGPEGGFCKEELDAVRNLPQCVSVHLGTRLLRADTAALTALACWQAILGDWGE